MTCAHVAPLGARHRLSAGHNALLYLVAGLLLGLAWASPSLAIAAWISAAVVMWATARCKSTLEVFGGIWLVGAVGHLVGLPWLEQMNSLVLGWESWASRALVLLQCACGGWWIAVCVALVWAITRALPERLRDGALLVGLPLAWALAEQLTFWTFGISSQAWLTTQWTASPVLRLLGHTGWQVTLLLCLLASMGPGLALARRSPRWAWTAALALVMCALPPLPQVGTAQLERIAAVHLTDAITSPHRLPDAAPFDLLIWPEQARFETLALAEGGTPGAWVRPLVPDARGVIHLAGYTTRAPHMPQQNQLLEVRHDGTVGTSRAKRLLMPLGERRVLGVGRADFAPGARSPMMEIAGRRLIALICGELLSRALVAEGVRDGGEVLVIAARDRITVGERALRHMLAVQVLRSVEFGVPSVRASLAGHAYFVTSDGEVLARSALDRHGILTWDRAHGARDFDFQGRLIPASSSPAEPAPPEIVVLYAREAPHLRTPCPEGRCVYYAIDDLQTCPAGVKAEAVIVAGHGKPPRWLAHTPAELSRAIRCFTPKLIVIDTCLGASGELLDALVDLEALVVAATTLIPNAGFDYAPAFFDPSVSAQQRAEAVRLPGIALLRWKPDARTLASARRWVEQADSATLRVHTARHTPPLVAAPLGAGLGAVLLPVEASRIGSPKRRKPRRPPHRAPLAPQPHQLSSP